ncbi:MAG: hypothetical protein MHM6MM_006607 [Cercozoa sp. M6MM]
MRRPPIVFDSLFQSFSSPCQVLRPLFLDRTARDTDPIHRIWPGCLCRSGNAEIQEFKANQKSCVQSCSCVASSPSHFKRLNTVFWSERSLEMRKEVREWLRDVATAHGPTMELSRDMWRRPAGKDTDTQRAAKTARAILMSQLASLHSVLQDTDTLSEIERADIAFCVAARWRPSHHWLPLLHSEREHLEMEIEDVSIRDCVAAIHSWARRGDSNFMARHVHRWLNRLRPLVNSRVIGNYTEHQQQPKEDSTRDTVPVDPTLAHNILMFCASFRHEHCDIVFQLSSRLLRGSGSIPEQEAAAWSILSMCSLAGSPEKTEVLIPCTNALLHVLPASEVAVAALAAAVLCTASMCGTVPVQAPSIVVDGSSNSVHTHMWRFSQKLLLHTLQAVRDASLGSMSSQSAAALQIEAIRVMLERLPFHVCMHLRTIRLCLRDMLTLRVADAVVRGGLVVPDAALDLLVDLLDCEALRPRTLAHRDEWQQLCHLATRACDSLAPLVSPALARQYAQLQRRLALPIGDM